MNLSPQSEEPLVPHRFEIREYTGKWDHNPPEVHQGDVVRVYGSGDPWRLEDQPDGREWHRFHAVVRDAGLLPVLYDVKDGWAYFRLEKRGALV